MCRIKNKGNCTGRSIVIKVEESEVNEGFRAPSLMFSSHGCPTAGSV